MHRPNLLLATALLTASPAPSATADTYLPWEGGASHYRRWSHGPRSDPAFFPIAVWLQSPARAAEYRQIGINHFVGLWKGPTAEQLRALAGAGMPVMAGYREEILSSPDAGSLRGWTLMDEPDNAQPKPGGGWGSCVLPSAIAEQYRRLKAADSSRPVYLNLGQGVINRTYMGRGSVCSRHDEHYPEYIRATDIVSYDVYPVNSGYPLWWVGAGVDRLREWANHEKPVWTWIEASAIRGGPRPTPAQIRAEVWMAIIHGAMGIGYFCHQFKPTADEAAPLHDQPTRQALAEINRQVTELAPALNTPPVANGVTVERADGDVPIDTMLKRQGGATYLFAVAARPGVPGKVRFQLRDCGDAAVTVLGEDRALRTRGGAFTDNFGEYEVHLYRIDFDPQRR